MLQQIVRFFETLLTPTSPQTELEQFLADRGITSPAELDFWMSEYDRRKRLKSYLTSRGRYSEANWTMRI